MTKLVLSGMVGNTTTELRVRELLFFFEQSIVTVGPRANGGSDFAIAPDFEMCTVVSRGGVAFIVSGNSVVIISFH